MKRTAYTSPLQPSSKGMGPGGWVWAPCLRSVSSSLAEKHRRHTQSCPERLLLSQSFRTASPGDPDGHISGDAGASGVWLLPHLYVSDWRGRYVQLWTAVTTAITRHVNSLCPVGSERRVGLCTQGFCVLFHSCNGV